MIRSLINFIRSRFARDIPEAEPDRGPREIAATFVIANDAPVQEIIVWSGENLRRGFGPNWTQQTINVSDPYAGDLATKTVLVPKLTFIVRDDIEALHFKMMWGDWIEGQL